MGIIVDRNTKVLDQGITGSQGSFHAKMMLEYGTKVLVGVTPGRGGTEVLGLPVFDTVVEAKDRVGTNASIVFVPASFAKDAALEAISAGLSPIVVITDGIPVRDTMEFLAEARRRKVTIVGPNCPGVITPGECKLGIMPGQIYRRGVVGIISRSGTLTYEVASMLTDAGFGQSTCLGLGGDPVVGLSFVDVLGMFRHDPETRVVVLIGEIGGNAEELAARYIVDTKYPKPVAAYVVGRAAPPGKRMGHAGAIITGRSGTVESKEKALTSAGVSVAMKPTDIPPIVSKMLKE
jgi:succinyl-CoA synthetase alpha subunit